MAQNNSLLAFFQKMEDFLEDMERAQTLSAIGPMALRVECKAEDRCGIDEHKHQCPSCHTTWKHDNALPYSGITSEQFHEAHSCPACGTRQTLKMED